MRHIEHGNHLDLGAFSSHAMSTGPERKTQPRHRERLAVISRLGLPIGEYAIGNSTAGVAHGLIDPTEREIHDLDVYASGRLFSRLAADYPVKIRHTTEGRYAGAFPVINPTGTPDIEIFRADIHPFDGQTLPGEEALLRQATLFDFGGGLGQMSILSVEHLLEIKKQFDRPQDRLDLAEMTRKLAEREQSAHRVPPLHRSKTLFLAGNVFYTPGL